MEAYSQVSLTHTHTLVDTYTHLDTRARTNTHTHTHTHTHLCRCTYHHTVPHGHVWAGTTGLNCKPWVRCLLCVCMCVCVCVTQVYSGGPRGLRGAGRLGVPQHGGGLCVRVCVCLHAFLRTPAHHSLWSASASLACDFLRCVWSCVLGGGTMQRYFSHVCL